MVPHPRTPEVRLARSIVWRTAGVAFVMIVAVSIVIFWRVFTNLEAGALQQAKAYIQERGAREGDLFAQTAMIHEQIKQEFLSQCAKSTGEDVRDRFDVLFEPWKDGTTRTRRDVYEGMALDRGAVSSGITGFVGKDTTVTPDLRRRLCIAYDVLSRWGPAHRGMLDNLYIGMYDNAGLIYWPGQPWNLEAPPEIDLNAQEYWFGADPTNCPPRTTVWTGIYQDGVTGRRMVSCLTPIDLNGRYAVVIGSDVLLSDLFGEIAGVGIPGSRNYLLSADGKVITHPGAMVPMTKDGTLPAAHQAEHERIEKALARVRGLPTGSVIESDDGKEYLAVARIEGPGWFFVTAVPKAALTSEARSVALTVLGLGVLALVTSLIVMFLLLDRGVVRPLGAIPTRHEGVRHGFVGSQGVGDAPHRVGQ